MISLMDKQEIILSHFREGKSQWQIHRDTGFDRKTIRKYINDYELKKLKLLASDESDMALIEDLTAAPKYDISNRVKRKLSDEIIQKINFYLEENNIKRETGRSKQQKKKIDIYECLIEEGYDISYPTVSNYIKTALDSSKEAFIRQEYQLGEICEFDWGM